MAPITIAHPLGDYLELKSEIDQAISKVLTSGTYILGHEVKSFENEFANYCQTQHAIGVGSGTSALYLTLLALDIGSGDEVILPSHTATATATAVIETGATPIYADISSNTYNLDPQSVEQCLSPQTKAIIAVHLYGHPAPINELNKLAQKQRIALIEDAAQAHGALYNGKKVGSLADVACFSFYPTKNLGAFGDGGCITTNNNALAEKIRKLREYGWESRYQTTQFGTNSRLDELQAAILRIKLKRLDNWNARRQNNARQLIEALKCKSDFVLPNPEKDTVSVYHQFVIQTPNRDAFMHKLATHNISCGIHYPWPNHKQKGYEQTLRVPLKNTENACSKIVSLPIHQHLSETDLAAIMEAFRTL